MRSHSTSTSPRLIYKRLLAVGFMLAVSFFLATSANAQTEVTGAIEGRVTSSQSPNGPIAGATVQIINLDTQVPAATKTDADGHFVRNSLQPGRYKVIVKAQNFKDYESDKAQRVDIQITRGTYPLPISLEPLTAAAAAATPEPQPGVTPSPTPVTPPATTAGTAASNMAEETNIKTEINTTDARRGGAYRDNEISTLPLGGTTLTRTFDELALLLPGVAPPPQTLGIVAGPGVGAGVGSAGQFSVNGMRSRANNFTVDGSDNNDEDIGVRRQGFFALVPQSTESIQEFRVTSLLAPAQYGRNFGGQINAVSKSGGNGFHGAVFGLLNSSQLNARNVFDTINGNSTSPIRSEGGQAVLDCTGVTDAACIARNRSLTTTNQSGGEDSFTLGQGGGVLGGPIKKDKAFFFVSYERIALNASKEASFAVPTVDQRGIFKSGATGFYIDCLDPNTPGFNVSNCTNANRTRFFADGAFPTSLQGDAVFSLLPFANNPTGIYGANTFTEVLPASARGHIASGKYDQNFSLRGKPQTLTARYNFTQDWRIIPVTGGALFSSLKPQVTTQNISTFLNSEITSKMNNVLRLSYGRTRLGFDEVRDPFLIPSQFSPNSPFLLNARRLENDTLPAALGVPNAGPVLYRFTGTTECGTSGATPFACSTGSGLGRIGQVNIAGFSPIGVDVNFFPQNRVNNTYQLADTVGYHAGNHQLAFGVDIRRVELNSNLPRNARTLLTFNGAPELESFGANLFTGNFLSGTDLAGTGTPSGAFLSLARTTSAIGLRYYESDAFFQDEFHFHSNMSINIGVRYEYNTPPREVHNLIERTFTDPALNDPNVAGLRTFIAGRTQIFERDRNNFVPRIGFAWSPSLFEHRSTVIRAGFGVYHDQILGALVSQSRNVYPNFVTVNTGGFNDGFQFDYFNPARGGICNLANCAATFQPLVQPGTLNTFNPNLTLSQVLNIFANDFPNPVTVTLPERFMRTPYAEQYSASFDQQLSSSMVLSVGYVGTLGHNLLRASTPNLGPNNVLIPIDAGGLFYGSFTPILVGFAVAPGSPSTSNFDRPTPNVGPVSIYESLGRSHYNALQVQLRGRFVRGLQYQANYTYSSAIDDASDVFDLAGANALPQNSLTRTGETGPSNFDARQRIAYNVIYDFPKKSDSSGFYKALFGGLQLASTGSFQTGQPFTVNSIFDVNLDGNLTDRLNTTQGIVITGDRSQPISLAQGVNTRSLLAAVGSDGRIARNTFRAGNLLNLDFSLLKGFAMGEQRKLVLRMDIFNFINRANYGIPVRFLEAPAFGRATNTVTPGRRIQFGLKFDF
jgi:hypothetical protein